MGRVQARAPRIDEYLNVPRHGRPDLRVVEGGRPEPEPVRSLRPDWLPADLELPEEPAPRRAERAPDEPAPRRAEPAPEEPRRMVVVTGRPHDDLRFEAYGKQKRRRRSPTAARLAGRPDRVAGWAVALGIAMALMAGMTAGSDPRSAGDEPAPPVPALGR